MGGSLEGGRKAAITNKKKYGKSFYSEIGKKGGKLGTTGGFASNKVGADGLTGRQRASTAGTVGSRKGRRGRR